MRVVKGSRELPHPIIRHRLATVIPAAQIFSWHRSLPLAWSYLFLITQLWIPVLPLTLCCLSLCAAFHPGQMHMWRRISCTPALTTPTNGNATAFAHGMVTSIPLGTHGLKGGGFYFIRDKHEPTCRGRLRVQWSGSWKRGGSGADGSSGLTILLEQRVQLLKALVPIESLDLPVFPHFGSVVSVVPVHCQGHTTN